jgi:hypothetical protein
MLVIFAEIVYPENIFVGDVAGGLGLGQEARFHFPILAPGLREDLDRHGAADNGIARPVHARHPAPEELHQLVFADTRGKLHQRPPARKLGIPHSR